MPYYAFSSDPRVADALACIGAAARRARHDRGLTQLSLELLTEVDQTTISRIENGLAPNVRLEYLARIIAVVGPLPPIERATRPIATRSLRAPWERAFAPDDANATD
jgi:transcriptional regulator with XRE-family HTH domain